MFAKEGVATTYSDIETLVNGGIVNNMTAESDKEPLDKAIEALLYVKKKQLFLDGNKRTAVILANHILIKSAAGLIVIPAKEVGEHKRLLVDYYETDKNEEIIKFLKDECYGPLK